MPRLVPLTALLAALALAVGLAACGDGDDGDGGGETTSTQAADGPQGDLLSTGIGDVTQGMSIEEVETLIGPPDKTQKAAGCELDPNAKESLAATYRVEGGTVVFVFELPDAGLTSYRSTGSELGTEKNDYVNDPFESLQAHWGDQLEIGLGDPNTHNGIWKVQEDPDSELLFDIRGGRIAAISGGEIQICE